MGLPEINRARIEKLNIEVDDIQEDLSQLTGDFENYEPVINDESFENTVPPIPQNVFATALFRNISVSWSFVSDAYISHYEVYASQQSGFTPLPADLIWKGKAGAYVHEASTGETWYFRVRAVNTHDVASDYSLETSATTTDISGFEIEQAYQDETITYANQYTDARETEIMTSVADKLDAQIYFDNIILKADKATVEEQFNDITADVNAKADSAYVNAELALRELNVHRSTTPPTDTNQLWLDRSVTPNVLKSFNGTAWVNASPTTAGEVGAYTKTEVDNALNSKASVNEVDLLEGRVTSAETSITQNANDIALKASQTELDALSGRVTSAETSITQNADAITLKASQTDLDGVEARVSTAETSITQNANSIALKASQTSVDDLTGRISTAESNITQNSNSIALKVSQTDFDNLSNQVTTNTSSITQNANNIALKVDQTTYDTDINDATNGLIARMSNAETEINLNTNEIALKASQTEVDTRIGDVVNRLDTNESQISLNSNEIALRVTTTTYNSGLSEKEDNIHRNTLAPADTSKLWLDTSIVPNILKRYDSASGTWVKASPTTAGEVGAYSQSAGNSLESRISTAESSITQNANSIALKASQSALDTTNNRLTTAESTISVNSTNISTKVEKDGVISSINQSAEAITISASKLNISGDVSVVNGLVTLNDLVVDSVHIKDGALIDRLFANSVITNRMIAGGVSADKVTTGTLSAIDITGVNISGSTFDSTLNSSNFTTISNSRLHAKGTYTSPDFGAGYSELDFSGGQFSVGFGYTGQTIGVLETDIVGVKIYDPTQTTKPGVYISASGQAIGFGDWFDGSPSGAIYPFGSDLNIDASAYVHFNGELKQSSSGVTTTFGARNSSYFHLSTGASSGFYFYDTVNVPTLVARTKIECPSGAFRIDANGGYVSLGSYNDIVYMQSPVEIRATDWLSSNQWQDFRAREVRASSRSFDNTMVMSMDTADGSVIFNRNPGGNSDYIAFHDSSAQPGVFYFIADGSEVGVGVNPYSQATALIYAGSYNQGSQRERKTNIRPLSTRAKDAVRKSPVYQFSYKEHTVINGVEVENPMEMTGFMFEEIPDEIKGINNSISLNSTIAFLWRGFQEECDERDAEIAELRERIDNLEAHTVV